MYLHADSGVGAGRVTGRLDDAAVALEEEAPDCSAERVDWKWANPFAFHDFPTTESAHGDEVSFVPVIPSL